MNVWTEFYKAPHSRQSRTHRPELVFVIVIGLAASIKPFASAQTFQVVYTYPGPNGFSATGVIPDANGNFFGATTDGGTVGFGYGTVFKIDPSGNETVLHSLNGTSDGSGPIYNITMDSTGNLYGVTSFGGNLDCNLSVGNEDGCGTVYKVDPAGNFTVLHTFWAEFSECKFVVRAIAGGSRRQFPHYPPEGEAVAVVTIMRFHSQTRSWFGSGHLGKPQ